MSELNNGEKEFYLKDLIIFCWKKKWHFIIPMTIVAILLVGFSILTIKMEPEKSPLPNKYTSTAILLVRESSATSGISSSISALASLGGINIGTGLDSSNGALITTIAGTNSFKDAVIEEFDLVSRYKIKKHIKSDTRKALDSKLSIEINDSSNVMSVSFTDIDPEFAQKVVSFAVNLLVERFYAINEEDNTINLKNYQEAMDASFKKILEFQKDIQELEQSVSNSFSASIPSIMFDVQMKKLELEAEETIYASFRGQHEMLSIQMKDDPITLKIIQDPEVPDKKSGPSRGMICIIGVIAVFAICFIVAFLSYFFSLEEQGKASKKEVSR